MDAPITVIIDMRAKPGGRAELLAFVERMQAEHGPAAAGYLGSVRHEVVGDPDRLIELADWESTEARAAHMAASAASGVYAPLGDLLAEPPRITITLRLEEGRSG